MIEAWWSSLDTALQVYYGIAIVTSVLLALQLVLLVFGFDGDGVDDFDADVHDTGMGVLSIRSVTAFFTGFGWGGVIALRNGLGLGASTVAALAAGGALMGTVVLIMRGFYSMRDSGTLDYRNAVGAMGNVYLPIPPSMQGPGQIEVLVQGRLKVVRAFTRSAARIPNHARVKVVEALDQQTLLVEPLDPPPAAAPPAPAAGSAGTAGPAAPNPQES